MRVALVGLLFIGVFGAAGAGRSVTVDAAAADALAADGAAAMALTTPLPAVADNRPEPVEPRTVVLPPRQAAPASVPDASSWALLIIGLGLAGLVARRRRDAQSVSA